MAEPRIQYARTEDGVSIAYAVFGEGSPLVYVSPIAGVHLYSQFSRSRISTNQFTSAGFRVVRYDGRGTGSSGRTARDFSLEARVRDLEAVVDGLDLRRFALAGHLEGGFTVIAYAARHPERVSHLALRDPHASTADFEQFNPARHALRALRPVAEENWALVTLALAHLGFGIIDTETGREYAAAVQSSMSPAVWVQMAEADDDIDVTELLGAVKAPTLIIYDTSLARNRSDDLHSASTQVAAAIPGARLQTTDDFAAAVAEFLREGDSAIPPSPGALADPVSFRTVLFTDLVGHTEMMSRLGDERGRAVLREHERITREVLKAHGGTEVKTMGDGFMASFGSVTKAVECAIGLQRAFADRDGEPLNVRVGLNAGEPIEEDGDLFGATVILASRIAAKADGGEILVADTVRGLCSGKGFLFANRGEFVAKGFEEPVRVYEVSWRN